MSDSATPWPATHQTPLSSTSSWSLLKFPSVEWVMLPNHLILGHPLLLLPSIFPSVRVFSNESALHLRWPGIRFGFNKSFQWIFRVDFLWDWPVWSPCSPKNSHESSPAPQSEIIHSLALSLLYGPTLTSIQNYCKNHCLPLVLLLFAIKWWDQSLLMKVKGEWKSWLKTQHLKNKDHGIWAHHFMTNKMGKQWQQCQTLFCGLQNHCRWWLQPQN